VSGQLRGEDLHGGGLARAVGAEDGEGLAAVDVEVETGDGGGASVGLAQAAHSDRWFVVHALQRGPARTRPRRPRGRIEVSTDRSTGAGTVGGPRPGGPRERPVPVRGALASPRGGGPERRVGPPRP